MLLPFVLNDFLAAVILHVILERFSADIIVSKLFYLEKLHVGLQEL